MGKGGYLAPFVVRRSPLAKVSVVRRSQLAKVVRGSRSASDPNLTTWVVYYEIDNWFLSIHSESHQHQDIQWIPFGVGEHLKSILYPCKGSQSLDPPFQSERYTLPSQSFQKRHSFR